MDIILRLDDSVPISSDGCDFLRLQIQILVAGSGRSGRRSPAGVPVRKKIPSKLSNWSIWTEYAAILAFS